MCCCGVFVSVNYLLNRVLKVTFLAGTRKSFETQALKRMESCQAIIVREQLEKVTHTKSFFKSSAGTSCHAYFEVLVPELLQLIFFSHFSEDSLLCLSPTDINFKTMPKVISSKLRVEQWHIIGPL